jgi:hypothetical protein
MASAARAVEGRCEDGGISPLLIKGLAGSFVKLSLQRKVTIQSKKKHNLLSHATIKK